ncbi:MAG: hypothetical protein ACJARD_001158 [Alphaproteobacteria bacterium]|jgi:hypothetical protein
MATKMPQITRQFSLHTKSPLNLPRFTEEMPKLNLTTALQKASVLGMGLLGLFAFSDKEKPDTRPVQEKYSGIKVIEPPYSYKTHPLSALYYKAIQQPPEK